MSLSNNNAYLAISVRNWGLFKYPLCLSSTYESNLSIGVSELSESIFLTRAVTSLIGKMATLDVRRPSLSRS